MSAWILPQAHINAMVKLAIHGPSEAPWTPLCDVSDPQSLGQSLWAENYKSINARYGLRDRAPRFVFDASAKTPNPSEALLVLSCYNYQTCEHSGWPASRARALCEALEKAIAAQQGWTDEQVACGETPGQDEARATSWPWEGGR